MTINNLGELQAEVARLRILSGEQGRAVAARFKSPLAIFSTAQSLAGHADLFSLASRFLIPLTLNKTLFSSSGVLVKTLVTLVSQKASPYVNEASVHKAFDTSKAFITQLFHKTSSSNL